MSDSKSNFTSHWKQFIAKWNKQDIKPKNIVQIKVGRYYHYFIVGYVHVTDIEDIYTLTDLNTGKTIEESNNMEMLGYKLLSHFIPVVSVGLYRVYEDTWALAKVNVLMEMEKCKNKIQEMN